MKQVGEAELLLQVHEQVENLGLDGDVEGGDGFVGDDDAGVEHEGAGDGDALALAAGEHVRVAAVLVGAQANLLHDRAGGGVAFGAVAAAVDDERLFEDGADGFARVERAVGVLEHHLDAEAQAAALGGAGGFGLSPVEQEDAVAGRFEQGRHAGEGGFAAAGFADDGQRLGLAELERDAVDGAHRAARAEQAAADGIETAQVARLHHRLAQAAAKAG